jgi:tetratricopeptide (TPR) repeat protein
MKNILKFISVLLILAGVSACETEFENHNAASEEAVYQTPEAYPGIIMGMTKHFTQNAVYEITRGPGVVAREISPTNTYLTENELESGSIPNENSSISALWRYLHYERGIAEKVVARIGDVTFPNDDEKAGIKAYAQFFKGMTTAYLGFYWEKATIENNPDNQAEFRPRVDVLQAALQNLDAALATFTSNAAAASYINTLVSEEFSIVDVINVMRARVYMELGDYQNAIAAANNVDLTTRSVWTYDNTTSNRNPIWKSQYDAGASERWRGQENMGVTPEAGDQRLAFYLGSSTGINSVTCTSIPTYYILGFWDNQDENIPVYLPDEVKLIKAEAYAHQGGGNLATAVSLIDEVRQDNADPFGVNAGLGAWGGNVNDQQEVLDQVYYNYAMELYLTGMRWLANRRIYPDELNGVTPPVDCAKKRSRNYFPYPYNEISNNPNAPADPSI